MKTTIIAGLLLASTAAMAQPEIHVTEGFVRHLQYSETGCQYVGENTVQEPAPLPQGHVQQIFQGTYNHNGSQSAPAVTPSVVEPPQ